MPFFNSNTFVAACSLFLVLVFKNVFIQEVMFVVINIIHQVKNLASMLMPVKGSLRIKLRDLGEGLMPVSWTVRATLKSLRGAHTPMRMVASAIQRRLRPSTYSHKPCHNTKTEDFMGRTYGYKVSHKACIPSSSTPFDLVLTPVSSP